MRKAIKMRGGGKNGRGRWREDKIRERKRGQKEEKVLSWYTMLIAGVKC